ncbi:MAG: histidine kinase [Chitinophagales bacterium]|nr:histidine kinase [Chitinophagaceae bacterium]MBP9881984.1 histidine kinase [Chitinophagales bacterium]
MLQDNYLRFIGMPILSALYTITVNAGAIISEQRSWWKQLLTDFLFVVVCWTIAREVIAFCRRRYPGFSNTVKRIGLLFSCTVLISFAEGFLITGILSFSNYYGVNFSISDYFFTGGLILVFSMMIVSVYELMYSLAEWKKLAVEAELLKRENLQSQLDTLKEQVKPHFLFNSLNSLLGLIDEDSRRAKKFVEELSFVYRYLLQSNEKILITVEEELDFINAYFFLLKTRFEGGLFLKIEVGDQDLHQLIPPLTLQLLLENAVKHNEVSEAFPLQVSISSANGDRLEIANELRRKSTGFNSTQKGLASIFAKYRLLHAPAPEVVDINGKFIVSIPLLKNASK